MTWKPDLRTAALCLAVFGLGFAAAMAIPRAEAARADEKGSAHTSVAGVAGKEGQFCYTMETTRGNRETFLVVVRDNVVYYLNAPPEAATDRNGSPYAVLKK